MKFARSGTKGPRQTGHLDSLAVALDVVLRHRRSLEMVAVPLDSALGRVLACPVVARESVPRFANSAMDGFALRAADTASAPVMLQLAGATMAGASPGSALGPGKTVRIMTGAPIPPGADAVCALEAVRENGVGIIIDHTVQMRANVRLPGEDVKADSEVFPVGTVIGPAHLGVLASLGERLVTVVRRPVVGVLSTGDELVDPARVTLKPGEIRDANRASVLGLLAQLGVTGVDLGIVGDEMSCLLPALKGAVGHCDALISSGGGGPR